MPENIQQHKVFSLREVALSIQRTLSKRYQQSFWVKAEINKLNFYSHSGHCYPDLLQKDDGKVVAQMRAMIWSSDFKRMNQNFLNTTGETLKDHINIMFLAGIQFDPNFGLSLRIYDIDPSFSLGELEREKLKTIEILKAEGIFSLNKSIAMPLLPKRLAIISVASSKGYADFIQLLDSRMKGYVIEHHLFSSLLQGEKAASQIIRRLKQIESISTHFDLVAIIRGGGGEVGLAAFNDLELARTIATFPLPVITGIGHATNITVAELVAHTNAITPSELADILLEQFESFIETLENAVQVVGQTLKVLKAEQTVMVHAKKQLQSFSEKLLMQEGRLLDDAIYHFHHDSNQLFGNHSRRLKSLENMAAELFNREISNSTTFLHKQHWMLKTLARQIIGEAVQQINTAENNVSLLHPDNVLKRGYSITKMKGKVLKSCGQLMPGEEIESVLFENIVYSKVLSIQEKNER